MNEELDKMKQYEVWEAVENDGQRTLDGTWVFTRETDGTRGLPSAYKARYVVKGFRQIEGKDYSELFASVARKDSIRVFLSIVNHLECHQGRLPQRCHRQIGLPDTTGWQRHPSQQDTPAQ
jgi:hypothetical protein